MDCKSKIERRRNTQESIKKMGKSIKEMKEDLQFGYEIHFLLNKKQLEDNGKQIQRILSHFDDDNENEMLPKQLEDCKVLEEVTELISSHPEWGQRVTTKKTSKVIEKNKQNPEEALSLKLKFKTEVSDYQKQKINENLAMENVQIPKLYEEKKFLEERVNMLIYMLAKEKQKTENLILMIKNRDATIAELEKRLHKSSLEL